MRGCEEPHKTEVVDRSAKVDIVSRCLQPLHTSQDVLLEYLPSPWIKISLTRQNSVKRHPQKCSQLALFFAKHSVLIAHRSDQTKEHAHQAREALHKEIEAGLVA